LDKLARFITNFALSALANPELTSDYLSRTVAPLPLLYATDQVQVTTHNYIMKRVPREWEVSADIFIRDVADMGRMTSAEECRQAQRSDSSTKIQDSKEAFKSTREYTERAQILPFSRYQNR
jgi:hypothetical protein